MQDLATQPSCVFLQLPLGHRCLFPNHQNMAYRFIQLLQKRNINAYLDIMAWVAVLRRSWAPLWPWAASVPAMISLCVRFLLAAKLLYYSKSRTRLY